MSWLREDYKETLQLTAGYIISLALIASSSLLIHGSLVFLKKFFFWFLCETDCKLTARFTFLLCPLFSVSASSRFTALYLLWLVVSSHSRLIYRLHDKFQSLYVH
jgi:hypothetical protein